jgi:hypothetical protein
MITVSRCASTVKVYVKGKSAAQSMLFGFRMLSVRPVAGWGNPRQTQGNAPIDGLNSREY